MTTISVSITKGEACISDKKVAFGHRRFLPPCPLRICLDIVSA